MEYVKSWRSIFTVTKAEAYSVVFEAGGKPTSMAEGIHKGGSTGYYNHLHTDDKHESHVWYLFG